MFARTLVSAWALHLVPVECGTYRGNWLEIEVGDQTFDVEKYGAKGDGTTDDTAAVQAALDAAGKEGGLVLFHEKNYLTTAFHFSGSKTTIKLPKHGRVTFDDDQSKYDGDHDLIESKGFDDIGIIGGGVFDGKGKHWWECREDGCFRPKFVHTSHTNRLLLKDVTFKDSPNHVLELYADYTEMTGVKVFAPPSTSSTIPVDGTYGPSHNTDAVDVHGTPFYINNCHLDTGDDNIAVHASHLLVEDSYMGHGHGASIGSCGSDTALHNITFRNLVFNKTGAAAKIKTRAGATGAFVRDVLWENLTLYDVKQSVVIDMFYDHGVNETTDFEISNITVKDLVSHGTKDEKGKKVSPGILHCQESSMCKDIHLVNIDHVDSKEAWDCYNVFGDADEVSPDASSCLRKETGRRRRGGAASSLSVV